MRKLLLTLTLFLILPLVSALDLEDYPDYFFQGDFRGKIVVGADAPPMDVASAVELIPGLQKHSSDRIRGSMLCVELYEG